MQRAQTPQKVIRKVLMERARSFRGRPIPSLVRLTIRGGGEGVGCARTAATRLTPARTTVGVHLGTATMMSHSLKK